MHAFVLVHPPVCILVFDLLHSHGWNNFVAKIVFFCNQSLHGFYMKWAYKPSVNILCTLLALEDAYMECEQDAQNVYTWLLSRNHKKAVILKKGSGLLVMGGVLSGGSSMS